MNSEIKPEPTFDSKDSGNDLQSSHNSRLIGAAIIIAAGLISHGLVNFGQRHSLPEIGGIIAIVGSILFGIEWIFESKSLRWALSFFRRKSNSTYFDSEEK